MLDCDPRPYTAYLAYVRRRTRRGAPSLLIMDLNNPLKRNHGRMNMIYNIYMQLSEWFPTLFVIWIESHLAMIPGMMKCLPSSGCAVLVSGVSSLHLTFVLQELICWWAMQKHSVPWILDKKNRYRNLKSKEEKRVITWTSLRAVIIDTRIIAPDSIELNKFNMWTGPRNKEKWIQWIW